MSSARGLTLVFDLDWAKNSFRAGFSVQHLPDDLQEGKDQGAGESERPNR